LLSTRALSPPFLWLSRWLCLRLRRGHDLASCRRRVPALPTDAGHSSGPSKSLICPTAAQPLPYFAPPPCHGTSRMRQMLVPTLLPFYPTSYTYLLLLTPQNFNRWN